MLSYLYMYLPVGVLGEQQEPQTATAPGSIVNKAGDLLDTFSNGATGKSDVCVMHMYIL